MITKNFNVTIYLPLSQLKVKSSNLLRKMKILLLFFSTNLFSAQQEGIVPYADFVSTQMIAGKELLSGLIEKFEVLNVSEQYLWNLLSLNCF